MVVYPFFLLISSPLIIDPCRNEAWSSLWTSTSSVLNGPATMVFARSEPKDKQTLAAAIGKGLSACAEAWSTNDDNSLLEDSVLDELLVELTPPMTIICQSAACYDLLFKPLIALILSDGSKAAVIAAGLLARFIGCSATKSACLEALKSHNPETVLIQVLSLVQHTTLRSRVLEVIMGGEEDVAKRLVIAAAVDDRKLLPDMLLADRAVAREAGQIIQSMFEETVTALLEDRGKGEKASSDPETSSNHDGLASSSLKAVQTLGTILCTPGMPHEERITLHLPDILNATVEHIQSGNISDAALWLEAALACCPLPGFSNLEPLLSNNSAGLSSEHQFAKGESVWYWLAQGDWIEAQVTHIFVGA